MNDARRPTQHGFQRGLTLLELMLAMFVGLVMTAGIVQLYLSNKQTYRVQEGLARLQENARFAAEHIARDLRLAGYRGCISTVAPGTTDYRWQNTLNADVLYNAPLAAEGFDASGSNTWTPAVYASLSAALSGVTPLDGTDVLLIRTAERTDAQLQSRIVDGSANISVNAGHGLNDDDIIVLADCAATAITQVTGTAAGGSQLVRDATTTNPGNNPADNTLSYGFDTDTEILRLVVKAFFIAPGASGEPSLWELRSTPAGNVTRELIEGIEDMQVLYGVDTTWVDANGDNGDDSRSVNRYVTAAVVNAGPDPMSWDNVVATRVSLLARSTDDLAAEAQPYTFNGVTQTPADNRMRRVFTSTVSVRNRLD